MSIEDVDRAFYRHAVAQRDQAWHELELVKAAREQDRQDALRHHEAQISETRRLWRALSWLVHYVGSMDPEEIVDLDAAPEDIRPLLYAASDREPPWEDPCPTS